MNDEKNIEKDIEKTVDLIIAGYDDVLKEINEKTQTNLAPYMQYLIKQGYELAEFLAYDLRTYSHTDPIAEISHNMRIFSFDIMSTEGFIKSRTGQKVSLGIATAFFGESLKLTCKYGIGAISKIEEYANNMSDVDLHTDLNKSYDL